MPPSQPGQPAPTGQQAPPGLSGPSGPPAAPPAKGPAKKLIPIILAAVLIGGLLTVGGLYFGGVFSSGSAPNEIRIEPVASVAADPFTPPVGPDVMNLPPPQVPVAAPGATPITTPAAAPGVVSGGKPGLYGGTGENRCDKNQLITFLQQTPAKAAVWAGVLGFPVADIPTYVNGLAEVVLQTDTAVTNHGFKNGRANRIPAILQAGTRVFVDNRGVPVAKCGCGNPLLDGKPVANPQYVGQPWQTFNPANVTVVQPSPTPLTTIPVANVYTKQVYPVQVVSATPAISGSAATPASSAPSTPSPAPSAAPSTPPPVPPTSAPAQDPLLPGTYQVTSRLVSCRDITPCQVGSTTTFTFTLACTSPTDCTIDGRPYTRSGSTLTSTTQLSGAESYDCNGAPVPTSQSVSLGVATVTGSPPMAQTLIGQLVKESPGAPCGNLEEEYELTYTRV